MNENNETPDKKILFTDVSLKTSLSYRNFFFSALHRYFLTLILGATTVLSFAPFNWFFVAFITFGVLGWCWQQSENPRQAAVTGFAFGFGLFGAGIPWIYVSLHDFGGMPMPIAIFAVLLLCAYLALFPALTGWLANKFASASLWRFPLAAAAGWTLTEWLRGWLFTGFPWLAIGYSQTPLSPLAGLAPIGGVYMISFATVFMSTLAANIVIYKKIFPRRVSVAAVGLMIFLVTAAQLKQMEWTKAANPPITVSLLQGNIPQDLKFVPEQLDQQLKTYLRLTREYPAQLIVMPESAIPLLKSDIPTEYWTALNTSIPQNGAILTGFFDEADEGRQIFNSVMTINDKPSQVYRKVHLVPFGEFIPLKWLVGWVYTSILNMPLADQTSGSTTQSPLQAAGEKIAVSICYEDVFGEEVIRQLPEATLLVNVSNDAWFGERVAPWQHTQIAQTRALETGRYLLRATNTGVTSIINHQGEVVSTIPQLTTGALLGKAQGRIGMTPYIAAGNIPIISICFVFLFLCYCRQSRKTKAIK